MLFFILLLVLCCTVNNKALIDAYDIGSCAKEMQLFIGMPREHADHICKCLTNHKYKTLMSEVDRQAVAATCVKETVEYFNLKNTKSEGVTL